MRWGESATRVAPTCHPRRTRSALTVPKPNFSSPAAPAPHQPPLIPGTGPVRRQMARVQVLREKEAALLRLRPQSAAAAAAAAAASFAGPEAPSAGQPN